MSRLLLVLSLACFLVPAAVRAAGALAVVVSPAFPVKDLRSEELSRIFLGKSQRLAGVALCPVNKETGSPDRAAFDKLVHHMDDTAMKEYWLGARIKGEGHPPRSFQSDAAILRYVSTVPGAVGYVGFPVESTQVMSLSINGVAPSAESGNYLLRVP
jgi:ABC-type phosphate transport system substrate-binding protein